MHDGPTGGKGVGSRTGWAGHDQAVGAIAADKFAVNSELKLNHAGERALVDHDFVQYALSIDHFAGAFELRANHDPLAERKAAFESVVEGGMQLFQREAGQKAEAAHIDGEDGNSTRGGEARRG